MFTASNFHGTIHALFSGTAAILCLFYADGKPYTTWFHCNFYKLHMFDIQKYFVCVSMGYFIQDFIQCIRNAEKGSANYQMILHHGISLIACLLSIYTGGFVGSVCQLSFLTEFSTPFVNMRQMIPKSSPLYLLNGIMMVLAFTVFRAFWYTYIIFHQMKIYILYRGYHFWDLYPVSVHWAVKSLILLSFIMLFLNCHWYAKMVAGLLNALGVNKIFEDPDELVDEAK